MTAVDDYRRRLRARESAERERFLRSESRLPGARANLELLAAAVEEASADELRAWAALGADAAPGNSPGEFVAAVGTAGLGRLLLEGDSQARSELRARAADPRWRVREAVAIALQRVGSMDMALLLEIARDWAGGRGEPGGRQYEQRAAVAALCEPPLLRDEGTVFEVLAVLDAVTASFRSAAASERRTEPYRVLAKALGYGWSVAVAAAPSIGKPAMERWLTSEAPDVLRVMRQNLANARFRRVDPAWVRRWLDRLGVR